ncbi:hypothetical protein L914_17870 [Phytophthora nicotianae]|uniref:RRM domain-containing protein n=2 Tax=Phytophthora nicotianae TaxID=4792 RepID=V9E7R1_PHYNI|nr:hypothetical protein F443_18570 [Phytophthora nicotianae P1569]ETM35173.1 hypothetical protein L914_17870 [Phytophthora nicotianae]
MFHLQTILIGISRVNRIHPQMARGAASLGDDSSSSGFSSDEDMADVSDLSSAALSVPGVQVEVLDEAEEIESKTVASPAPTDLEASTAFTNVLQCCRDVANTILQTQNPLDVQYDQYTAAIGHVTWHWPTSETIPDAAELENKLKTYHSLRADLYKAFQKAFPLTEDMYVQWISDSGARGDYIEEIKRLFELSQGDYWSVSLTLQYLRFIKDNGDDKDLEMAMHKAQNTLGAHFARGHEIWALCRDLTTEKYDEMDQTQDAEKERAIRTLFCSQMQLPLDQNDLVMSEFRAWDTYNALDEASGAAFEEASTRQTKLFAPLMKKLRGFETRINAAPGTEDAAAPEQVWLQYLNFVKHRVAPLMSGETERKQLVVCLYERAVSVMCLSPTLWTSYLEYLEPDQAESNTADKLTVARRAVRNVPFDSSVWMELLIEMEKQGSTLEVSDFVRRELLTRSSSPLDQYHLLNVLLAWCDSVRRYASISIDGEDLEDTIQQVETLVGKVFAECQEFMTKAFPDYREGLMRLAEYQAKCYWALMPPDGPPRRTPAIAMKVSKVTELWKSTLSISLGDQTATWIAYLEALRRMNAFSVSSIRTMVFDEALKRVKDYPLTLAESWLVFERENGDLTNYLRARRYHMKHRTSQTPAQVIVFTGDEKVKNAKKRKADTGKQSKNAQKPAKRAKPTTTEAVGITEKVSKPAEKKKIHESLTNEHTLFLCNVSKEASKGDIEALFRDIPTLKDVRLVVKTRGDRVKSRGMAYVQFSDDAGVEEGLKRDGFLLHGHPLRVERSKPPPTSASTPSKPSGGEGFWKPDPLTLYIGDLNREGSKDQVTEEQLQVALQQSMQAAGELVVVTRVSILKDRHGKRKNYGLVEVAESSQATFCLANVAALQSKLGDQVTMKPSRFSISHILEQQEKQKQKQRQSSSKVGSQPHAKPSTRLALPSTGSTTSLMPRALRRKLAAQDNTAKNVSAAVTPKSNEDFRKMLFNK